MACKGSGVQIPSAAPQVIAIIRPPSASDSTNPSRSGEISERDRDLLGQDQPLNMRRDPATASDLARGVTRFLTPIRR
jgi:hypothetical protein